MSLPVPEKFAQFARIDACATRKGDPENHRGSAAIQLRNDLRTFPDCATNEGHAALTAHDCMHETS